MIIMMFTDDSDDATQGSEPEPHWQAAASDSELKFGVIVGSQRPTVRRRAQAFYD
jgi:hypothetical protein